MSYETILSIVEKFYALAKKDVLIGYHFRFIDDFDEHIPRIADFWNLQLNGKLQDKSHLPFDLISTHAALKINLGEINRWVKLFEDVLNKEVKSETISPQDKRKWMEKVQLFKQKIK